jgi:hypothetical protein
VPAFPAPEQGIHRAGVAAEREQLGPDLRLL